MIKFLHNRLFIILFLNIIISSIALSGPLDIEKIKNECLRDFQTESSSKYTKCVKDKINKILDNEPEKK